MFATPKQPDQERRSLGSVLLRYRYLAYGLILLGILVYRLTPGERARNPRPAEMTSDKAVVLSGLGLAPNLIPKLAAAYREIYPQLDIRIHDGGSKLALQEIANRDADIAFLNRRPTEEEQKIISAVADSAESWPIALGGIAVLSGKRGGADSITVRDLRAWMLGGGAGAPAHIYAPDPNTGLWESVTMRMGIPADPPSTVVWLAGDAEVAQAVANDPGSIGFVSTLSMPSDLDRIGARLVAVRGDTTAAAALPWPAEIARGQYPLYHYLYLACLPDVRQAASGFITFMHSPRGQRLIERNGVLPAREVARMVQLVQKPVG